MMMRKKIDKKEKGSGELDYNPIQRYQKPILIGLGLFFLGWLFMVKFSNEEPTKPFNQMKEDYNQVQKQYEKLQGGKDTLVNQDSLVKLEF